MAQRQALGGRPNRKSEAEKPLTKDKWDKIEIVLKSAGAFLTAFSVAAVGFFGSQYLARTQEAETNTRLYTELMSKREESDSALRKDMFNSIIANFLKPEPANLQQKVLNLELLAFNFHESLDLAPLFKEVHQKINESGALAAEQKELLSIRLEKVSKEIVNKQISTLIEAGGKLDGRIDLDELNSKPEGITVIDDEIEIKQNAGGEETLHKWRIRIEALTIEGTKKEVRLRLEVYEGIRSNAEVTYWIGFFNFPMLNNIRLPAGRRCAIALREYGESNAEITFVYFPSSRSSIKEKPYYDEIIYDLLRVRKPLSYDEAN